MALLDAADELDRLRVELVDTRTKLAAVRSLANIVRDLQPPDPDTGDRDVSFFALIEALGDD